MLCMSLTRALPTLLGVSLFVLAACSDDEPAKSDAGAGKKDAGGDAIPRLDAGDDVVPVCDRFVSGFCGDGQVCNELIRELPDGNVVLYTGCVDAPRLRALGDPCTPWSELYDVPGLRDVVQLDPCGEGTVCVDDPEVRGSTSCQLACQSGVYGDGQKRCASSSAYCFGSSQYLEVCVESDACDPVSQKGCPAGKNCYLQLGDDAESVLSVCLTAAEEPVADQKACVYVNDCARGSSCFGPVGLSPAEWGQSDFVCRPVCGGPGGADAGAGDDAGTDDAGAAPGSACTCEPYTSSSLDFSEIPSAPYGQCEL